MPPLFALTSWLVGKILHSWGKWTTLVKMFSLSAFEKADPYNGPIAAARATFDRSFMESYETLHCGRKKGRPSITKSSSLSSRSTSVETLLLFSKHDAHSSCQVFTQSEEIPRGLRVER